MRRTSVSTLIAILLVVGVLSVTKSARAIGLGGYMGFTHTAGEVDFFDHKNNIFDLGFSFDTNLAADRLINFRLYSGIQVGERDYNGFKEKTFGATFAGTLGFSLHRSSTFRVWLGPSFRFSIDGCTNCSGYDSDFYAVGIGPELGFNFNLDNRMTISPSIGYQFMYAANKDDFGTLDGHQHHLSLLLTIYWRSAADNF